MKLKFKNGKYTVVDSTGVLIDPNVGSDLTHAKKMVRLYEQDQLKHQSYVTAPIPQVAKPDCKVYPRITTEEMLGLNADEWLQCSDWFYQRFQSSFYGSICEAMTRKPSIKQIKYAKQALEIIERNADAIANFEPDPNHPAARKKFDPYDLYLMAKHRRKVKQDKKKRSKKQSKQSIKCLRQFGKR